MRSKENKLSLLSEMITFAKTGDGVNDAEYNFLLAVANQIGVTKEEFDALFEAPAPRKTLVSETERIVQFHRLVLLMNVDGEIREDELIKLHEFGLRMGLHPDAIDQVLKVMHHYENKVVPPEVLINIFKTYYN